MEDFPTNYGEWRECIEVHCRMRITEAFCKERIADLEKGKSLYASRFIELYGEQHLRDVLEWMRRAQAELQSKG